MDNPNLQVLTDELFDIRERTRKLKASIADRLAELEARKSEVEQQLHKAMKAAGTTRCAGNKASYVYDEYDHFTIVDMTKFRAYLKRSGNVHLLENRVAQKAAAELASKIRGKRIPGLKKEEKPSGRLTEPQ